jgi:hypothetical protein
MKGDLRGVKNYMCCSSETRAVLGRVDAGAAELARVTLPFEKCALPNDQGNARRTLDARSPDLELTSCMRIQKFDSEFFLFDIEAKSQEIMAQPAN